MECVLEFFIRGAFNCTGVCFLVVNVTASDAAAGGVKKAIGVMGVIVIVIVYESTSARIMTMVI